MASPSWPGGLVPHLRSRWQAWGRNLALFVLTFLSVVVIGSLNGSGAPDASGWAAFNLGFGLRLAAGALAILLAHEFGHYFAARYYGVDVTLPFFIPFPVPFASLVGTLGAFIRIRSPIPHRRALFDIGVAGPLAGFAVALPVLWLGMREASVRAVTAETDGIPLGAGLLFQWATELGHGSIPSGQSLFLGPLALAAWFGLLVTALNLMPIGQLDGGHAVYALVRGRAHRISRAASWLCVALVYVSPSWILWAILMRLLGRPHPPTLDDDAPIGAARLAVGVLTFAVFALCFMPDPIASSWSGLFEALGWTAPTGS